MSRALLIVLVACCCGVAAASSSVFVKSGVQASTVFGVFSSECWGLDEAQAGYTRLPRGSDECQWADGIVVVKPEMYMPTTRTCSRQQIITKLGLSEGDLCNADLWFCIILNHRMVLSLVAATLARLLRTGHVCKRYVLLCAALLCAGAPHHQPRLQDLAEPASHAAV